MTIMTLNLVCALFQSARFHFDFFLFDFHLRLSGTTLWSSGGTPIAEKAGIPIFKDFRVPEIPAISQASGAGRRWSSSPEGCYPM